MPSIHRSLSAGLSAGSSARSRFVEEQPSPHSVIRSLVDGAAAAAAPNHGVDFRFIESGSSEVDRLMDNAGNFETFGEYVRAETLFQRSCRDQGEEIHHLLEFDQGYQSNAKRTTTGHEKVLRWRSAANKYRRWAADQIYPSVRRAISSPDGMFEMNSPDGGAIIPSHFVMEVWDKARAGASPFSMAKIVVVPTVSGVLPGIFETSRVTGSRWGGLTANWLEEGSQLPTSTVKLAVSNYRLKKLAILIPTTDELWDDAGMLDAFLTETCSKELEWQATAAMMTGTAGMPNGMVNGPGTITIAKDTGQAAGTISASNVSGMWSRMHGPSRARSCWFAHQDFDPDSSLGLPVNNLTGWAPPVAAPTLKGRPVYPLEQASALGVPGDLLLCDPSQYLLVFTGIRKSISAHLKWDRQETYLKMIFRVDGQSLWPAPITPPSGTLTKAPFVVIAQR